jgi:hypothetical protein
MTPPSLLVLVATDNDTDIWIALENYFYGNSRDYIKVKFQSFDKVIYRATI